MLLRPLKETITKEQILLAHTRAVTGKADPTLRRADGLNQVDYEMMVNFGEQAEVIRSFVLGERNLEVPPAKRIQKKKSNGEFRYIDMPVLEVVHLSRLLLDHGLQGFAPQHPLYGYPSKRDASSPLGKHAAIERLRKRNPGSLWIVKNDVKKAFDSVPFVECDRQLEALFAEPDLSLVRKIMRMPILWPNGTEEDRIQGIPQGLSLSSFVLAMVLRSLPDALCGVAVEICIYVDDILVLTQTKEDAHKASAIMEEYLRSRGLDLKYDRESSIFRPGQPVQYLGDEVVEWEG